MLLRKLYALFAIAISSGLLAAAETIVIDPGHGGSVATGGSSPNNATAWN